MYTKAYLGIHPIVGKRFTKASPCRTLKTWKPMFSDKIVYVVS